MPRLAVDFGLKSGDKEQYIEKSQKNSHGWHPRITMPFKLYLKNHELCRIIKYYCAWIISQSAFPSGTQD
jgi:hypothetical protein